MSAADCFGGGSGGGMAPLGTTFGGGATGGANCWWVANTGDGRTTSSGFVSPAADGLGGPAEADMLLAFSSWVKLTEVAVEPPNGFLPRGVPLRVTSPSPDWAVGGAGDPVALVLPPTWIVIFLGCAGVSELGILSFIFG